MRFIVKTKKGYILTDEYSKNEITHNLHIKNIKDDLIKINVADANVYDVNFNLLFKLNNRPFSVAE